MTTLTPCTFCFADDTEYSGFTDGTTWNGFDNVYVAPETHKEIEHYFFNVCGYDKEEISLPDSPNDDGLYDYSNGFATSIVNE